MKKRYSFIFPGTKEIFLNLLDEYPNSKHKEFFFDNYLIEVSGDEIRFGLSRDGHSGGGYWFIPTITERNGKTIFCGTIERIGPPPLKKRISRDDAVIWLFAFPVLIVFKVWRFFSFLTGRITGKIKPKEKYLEDRLYELMEKYLICQRQICD